MKLHSFIHRYGKNGLVVCHICGLPILLNVPVQSRKKHKLFGTVDHVIPLSKGGPGIEEPSNKLPAHRFCNELKGALLLTEDLQEQCRKEVQKLIPHLSLPDFEEFVKLQKQQSEQEKTDAQITC